MTSARLRLTYPWRACSNVPRATVTSSSSTPVPAALRADSPKPYINTGVNRTPAELDIRQIDVGRNADSCHKRARYGDVAAQSGALQRLTHIVENEEGDHTQQHNEQDIEHKLHHGNPGAVAKAPTAQSV